MRRGPVDQGDPMPTTRTTTKPATDRLLMRHVVDYVRRLGGTIRREDGEYRLAFPNADPLHTHGFDPESKAGLSRVTGSTYFTDDLLDALQTARAWQGTGTRPDMAEAELLLPLRWRLSTDAERFFLDHAGYSRRLDHAATAEPRLEDVDDARLRSARELARAEAWAKDQGYTFSKEPDPDADESWMVDETPEYRKEWSGKAWAMVMYEDFDNGVDAARIPCQSLSGCYGDSDYERVIRAELALQQMVEVEKRAEGVTIADEVAMTDAGYDSLPGAAEDRRTSEAMAAKRDRNRKGGR